MLSLSFFAMCIGKEHHLASFNEMVGGLEMPVLVKNIVDAIRRVLGADASSLYLSSQGYKYCFFLKSLYRMLPFT